jgi:protoheme IX farnesyltransferase
MSSQLRTLIIGQWPVRTAAAAWRRYFELTKPKVVALITFTGMVGTLLASAGVPSLGTLVWASAGIALAAASAATLNHVLEWQIDAQMARTRARPLPAGRLSRSRAIALAVILAALAMGILVSLVNAVMAVLTFVSLIAYAGLYTVWLKHATPQNIVIGGVAGAMPPVLGWTAITGRVDANALLLFLIIFVWTPPHFWALAIARRAEYERAGIPMLPVTHGVAHTRQQVLLYTILLTVVTLLPFLTGMSGPLYLAAALILDAAFLCHALALKRSSRSQLPMQVFRFSVSYLMWLFAALLIDHYLPTERVIGMRLVILGLCALVAAGVFAAMFLAIWSTRRARAVPTAFRQSFATELVWAAIPCLMILAAAIPAVIAIVSAHTRE